MEAQTLIADLSEMHEGTKPVELEATQVRELAGHEHPGVRGLILCLAKSGAIDLPADLVAERQRLEKDEVNRLELQEFLDRVRGKIDNVHFL